MKNKLDFILCLALLSSVFSCSEIDNLEKDTYKIDTFYYVDTLNIDKPYLSVVGYKYGAEKKDAKIMVKYLDYKKILCDNLNLPYDSVGHKFSEDSYINTRKYFWNLTGNSDKYADSIVISKNHFISEFVDEDSAIVHLDSNQIFYLHKNDKKWLIFKIKNLYQIGDTIPSKMRLKKNNNTSVRWSLSEE